jgi:tRNA A-37 threonylcarbamoyl transferase component Bud32
VNLRHPCIATPIGFVFRVESSGLRELKIVGLSIEGCSLRDVVLSNPVWWTPTVKAKAVVGIALGLQFGHSFGMIHGRLNSNTILFDESHRIQITDFGLIDFEMQGSESGTGSDVFCEEWNAQADIDAFGSLFIEIMVDQDVPDFVSKMIEAIGSRDYEEINSMNHIVDILKTNEFEIETDVDSVEVWEFVHWVENWEE